MEEVIAMVSMFIVGSILTLGLALGMVLAAIADQRRSIAVVADGTRFAPQEADARLPWLPRSGSAPSTERHLPSGTAGKRRSYP